MARISSPLRSSAVQSSTKRTRRSCQNRRRPGPGPPNPQSRPNSARRTKGVQIALNRFGYPVGTPDGATGPKSRAAISELKAFLGYPATGALTAHERIILVSSSHSAVAGGPVIARAVAGSVHGLKAVLIAQRDEMAGVGGRCHRSRPAEACS
ncbi:MAG: hypothetical protein C0524_13760 [Rhodobacter sp.]|nr:hypothetical protein [Rhodobacter sp.]